MNLISVFIEMKEEKKPNDMHILCGFYACSSISTDNIFIMHSDSVISFPGNICISAFSYN